MLNQANPRSLRILVGIVIAIVALMALSRGVIIWSLRTDTVDDAFRDTGNIATILAQHTSQSVKGFDAALIELQQQLTELHEAAPDKYQEAIRSKDIYALLTSSQIRMPQSGAIAILGTNGHLANYSQGWPAPDTDVSDRELFSVLHRDTSSGMYVALPIVTRTGDGERVFLSRRVTSREGEFLGVVQISVNIEYFNRLYNSINSLADLSLMFLRSDGAILLRYPMLKPMAGERIPPASEWHGIVARGGGFLRVEGLFGHGPRFVAVRPVPGYPLVVNVAVSESASLAPWRRRATLIVIGTALTLVCFVLILCALFVQLRKLAHSRASIVERESRLKEKSRELESANLQIDAALNNMTQGLSMIDREGRIVVCNGKYLHMYDLPPELVRPGANLIDVLSYRRQHGSFDDDPVRFVADIERRLAAGEKVQTRAQLADGRIINVVNEPMIDGGWVATHEDITERLRSEERIARMARHDALTDLANRVLFRERLDEAFRRYESEGKGYTVFIFDLDLFKAVNDSLGHPVGDSLLKAVARRLQEATRATDTVGRLGGDEFAILQHSERNQREIAVALATRLLEVIGAPYEVDGHRVVIGISIGIAMAPDDGLDSRAPDEERRSRALSGQGRRAQHVSVFRAGDG